MRFGEDESQQYSATLLPADAGANRAHRMLQGLIDAEKQAGTGASIPARAASG